MNREEAIKRLKWFKEYNEEDYCGGDRIQDDSGDWFYRIIEEDLEAFEIAIEALEQESSSSEIPNKSEIPTGSDDCISRQDILSEIIRFSTEEGASVECQQLYCDVNNMPPVTPIKPKGHWCPQNDDYFDWYECSECGYGSEGEMQYSSEVDVRTNYCPNCGSYNGGASNGNE